MTLESAGTDRQRSAGVRQDRLPDRQVSTLHEHAVFQGGSVLTGIYELADDVDPHAHDFLEIAVVGSGVGTHLTSQGERSVWAGDVMVLRPGAWHGFRDCRDLTVANCCVSAPALRSDFAVLREISSLRQLLWTDPAVPGSYGVSHRRVSPDRAREVIVEIGRLGELLGGAGAPGFSAGGGQVGLLGQLITVLGAVVDVDHPPAGEPEPHPAVVAVIALLEKSPELPWRIDDLARTVSLDPDYLGRLFGRDVGLSPLGVLARIRAERAAVLLARTSLPASRVGAAVGWDDPTYFTRRFRALLGLTPTEYRRRTQLRAG